jgi:hypothetical protein
MQSFVDRNEVAGIVTLLARHGRIAHLGALYDSPLKPIGRVAARKGGGRLIEWE